MTTMTTSGSRSGVTSLSPSISSWVQRRWRLATANRSRVSFRVTKFMAWERARSTMYKFFSSSLTTAHNMAVGFLHVCAHVGSPKNWGSEAPSFGMRHCWPSRNTPLHHLLPCQIWSCRYRMDISANFIWHYTAPPPLQNYNGNRLSGC